MTPRTVTVQITREVTLTVRCRVHPGRAATRTDPPESARVEVIHATHDLPSHIYESDLTDSEREEVAMLAFEAVADEAASAAEEKWERDHDV